MAAKLGANMLYINVTELLYLLVERHRGWATNCFILYLPYIQNFTMQDWNNEIKEKVNGKET